MEPTVQNPKRDPERHLRIQLTDPYSSQPLESRDDWRAGKSREKQEGAERELKGSSAEAKRRPLSHPRSE